MNKLTEMLERLIRTEICVRVRTLYNTYAGRNDLKSQIMAEMLKSSFRDCFEEEEG